MRIVKSSSWKTYELAKENSCWGANQRQFTNWSAGEIAVVLIESDGVAAARVVGHQFYSDLLIWENSLYAWRIPVEFFALVKGEIGAQLQLDIRRFMRKEYGSKYGSLILLGHALQDSDEEQVVKLLQEKGCWERSSSERS